jgi:Bifunctional DNA primase/polymerase, N-terminal
MVDTTQLDAITKLFEDFAASSAESIARASLFEPWEDWPRPGTPEAIALQYTMRDWNPVPVPYRQKKPTGNGWQHRVITGSKVDRFFSDQPQNIGVQLGPKSRGLTDVELDCEEAIVIASAVLPRTDAIFGRASKRNSHRLYNTSLALKRDQAALQFKDPMTKRMLLEVRIGGGDKGAQTVFPGSTHESGEPIKWEEDGEPAQVDDDELLRRAELLGALCLLARYWPPKPKPGESGGRHDAALTVGGFLARCGFNPAYVKLCVEWIARAAEDEEYRDRIRAAHDATLAYDKGEKTRGYTALKETFGKAVADKVAAWLHYSGPADQNARADSERVAKDGTAKTEEEATRTASLPIIDVRGGELSKLASRGEDILNAAGVQIFQRSRQLVRPVIEEADARAAEKPKSANSSRSCRTTCAICCVATRDGRSLTRAASKMCRLIHRTASLRPCWRARGTGGFFPRSTG